LLPEPEEPKKEKKTKDAMPSLIDDDRPSFSINDEEQQKPKKKPKMKKEYLDAQGRLDMEKAPTELIVDQANKVQEASKKSG
jgi:hypothetical protein